MVDVFQSDTRQANLQLEVKRAIFSDMHVNSLTMDLGDWSTAASTLGVKQDAKLNGSKRIK